MRHFAQCLLLLLALLIHYRLAIAQDLSTEEAVRAAMVFNFLKFTEAPPDLIANAQKIKLCVAVADFRQAEALAALSGRKVWGHELIVVRLTGRDDNCQVLYVDSRSRWNAVEEQGPLRRVLTISAYPGFVRDRGMIEIALKEDGVRFDINLAESRSAGYRFSPQLLRLARQIVE